MLSSLSNGLRAGSKRALSTTNAVRSAEHGGADRWKKATFFIAVPAILLGMANTYATHVHIERPEFVAYEHMRQRTHKFPWGDGNHSLFHNRERNPLPDGYEE